MKQSEIIKILSSEFKTSKLEDINKALKAKKFNTKFRMTGPGFVNSGFTGLVKALTDDGIKIYNVSRVNLVRYEDIDTFAKAQPKDKEEKKKTSKPAVSPPQQKVSKKIQDEEEEDYENDDDFDPYADADDDVIEDDSFTEKFVGKKKNEDDNEGKPKPKKKNRLHQSGSGSLFIPRKK